MIPATTKAMIPMIPMIPKTKAETKMIQPMEMTTMMKMIQPRKMKNLSSNSK